MKEDIEDLKKNISVIMFLHNNSISLSKIKSFIEEDVEEIDIINAIELLQNDLEKIGLTIITISNKDKEFIISVNKSYSELAKKLKEDELETDLTPASLQTLTICAYLGASTKEEISFIRGIQSIQSIKSLVIRGLLKKIGDKYILSIDALQKLGINKVNDLPEYDSIKEELKSRLKDLIIVEE